MKVWLIELLGGAGLEVSWFLYACLWIRSAPNRRVAGYRFDWWACVAGQIAIWTLIFVVCAL